MKALPAELNVQVTYRYTAAGVAWERKSFMLIETPTTGGYWRQVMRRALDGGAVLVCYAQGHLAAEKIEARVKMESF